MLIGVKRQEWSSFTSQLASELCAMFFCIQMVPYGQVYCEILRAGEMVRHHLNAVKLRIN